MLIRGSLRWGGPALGSQMRKLNRRVSRGSPRLVALGWPRWGPKPQLPTPKHLPQGHSLGYRPRPPSAWRKGAVRPTKRRTNQQTGSQWDLGWDLGQVVCGAGSGYRRGWLWYGWSLGKL